MVVDALRARARRVATGPTIVCAQLGEVNTGACDDLEAIADAVEEAGAWLHVDGAFGLWAAASPALAHLTAGLERADSWATDAHKWLNVPYDVGIAFCAHPESHRAALGIRSAYLLHAEPDAGRDPLDWTPEHSRRARGFTTYAALRSLGRSGVAELVDRTCARARALAEALAGLPGCEVLNDVVLNQVLFRFEDDEATDAFVAAVQSDGEAWLGGTRVGRPARRAPLGLELAHERGRRRARGRGVRGGAERDHAGRAGRLGKRPKREQLGAVLAQPVALGSPARAPLADERPELPRVVRLPQVAELVHDHVVEHRVRREHEPPVERQRAARRARAPAVRWLRIAIRS